MKKKRAESREGHITTTVSFPEELHRRLAIAALEDRIAIVEIIRQAVSEWLDERSERTKGRRV